MRWRPEGRRDLRDRAELLSAIAVRGQRLRRRTALVHAAVALALVVAAGTTAAITLGDDPEEAIVADSATSTSVQGQELSSTTSSAPTSTSEPTVVTDSTSTLPPSTGTTVPTSMAPSCRNSSDPQCGPLRWDPDPGPGSLSVELSYVPAAPRVGEEVSIVAHVSSGETTDFGSAGSVEAGDGTTLQEWSTYGCGLDQPTPRHGPWTPPPPEPSSRSDEWRHTYSSPGTYEIRVTYIQPYCDGAGPYPAEAIATVTITVSG